VTTTETASLTPVGVAGTAAPEEETAAPATLRSAPAVPEERQPTATRTSQVVLRRVEPISVLRLSLVFYGCVCAVLLVAGIVLWIGAALTGVVGNLESFIRDAGFNDFHFAPLLLFKAFTLLGVTIVAAGTLANLLLATLFNLLSEALGGLRVTLAEDIEPDHGR
jgi:hypothetical protein